MAQVILPTPEVPSPHAIRMLAGRMYRELYDLPQSITPGTGPEAGDAELAGLLAGEFTEEEAGLRAGAAPDPFESHAVIRTDPMIAQIAGNVRELRFMSPMMVRYPKRPHRNKTEAASADVSRTPLLASVAVNVWRGTVGVTRHRPRYVSRIPLTVTADENQEKR